MSAPADQRQLGRRGGDRPRRNGQDVKRREFDSRLCAGGKRIAMTH